MNRKQILRLEINKALKMLKNILDGTNWITYKQGAYGITAYNVATKQIIRTVYAFYAEDFVDRVLTEIRFIEASNH